MLLFNLFTNSYFYTSSLTLTKLNNKDIGKISALSQDSVAIFMKLLAIAANFTVLASQPLLRNNCILTKTILSNNCKLP